MFLLTSVTALQRRLRGGGPVGAFAGWRVLLGVDPSVHDGFVRLLEAGGATVLRDPFVWQTRPRTRMGCCLHQALTSARPSSPDHHSTASRMPRTRLWT